MLEAREVIECFSRNGFSVYSGVPCSLLTPLIDRLIDPRAAAYYAASNEGEAVAFCAGAHLAGKRAVVMMQNSGLGNAVNPLTSLNAIFKTPVLLVITLRGEPGEHDEPQHELMGRITGEMLDCMGIAREYFPDSADKLSAVVDKAGRYMQREQLPFALILKKGVIRPNKAVRQPALKFRKSLSASPAAAPGSLTPRISRYEMLKTLVSQTRIEDSVLVATTGFTGRELYAIDDRPNQLYMVGSMGCALPFGLGAAVHLKKKVFVLDGDGAVLMHLGALPMAGRYGKGNLTHIVFDNASYLSTGGQATLSSSVDLCAVAIASGYKQVMAVDTLKDFQAALRLAHKRTKDTFILARVNQDAPADLPRPTIKPHEVLRRLQLHLRSSKR
ncbi:MAG TPA: phosphonopyruvate decarboxylase [Candidatus Omnitrophota bacterium]|nr:phosphonopyruvate decarboxylase [Candidatus Omnitrophota bacterium]HRZ15305.1 phosphonopyruvate decarboxylase [Candidatus Omnitrophota bacterium]